MAIAGLIYTIVSGRASEDSGAPFKPSFGLSGVVRSNQQEPGCPILRSQGGVVHKILEHRSALALRELKGPTR